MIIAGGGSEGNQKKKANDDAKVSTHMLLDSLAACPLVCLNQSRHLILKPHNLKKKRKILSRNVLADLHGTPKMMISFPPSS